jgi:hypothetical protein
MLVFVEAGDKVEYDELRHRTVFPLRREAESVTVTLFCSPNRGVKYTYDEGCVQKGQMQVPVLKASEGQTQRQRCKHGGAEGRKLRRRVCDCVCGCMCVCPSSLLPPSYLLSPWVSC